VQTDSRKTATQSGVILRKLEQMIRGNLLLYVLVRKIVSRYLFRYIYEGEFRAFKYLNFDEGVFVDIGANDGISSKTFRIFNKNMPIIAFEPLECHRDDLARTQTRIENFQYHIVGLGAKTEILELYYPSYRGHVLSACASYNREGVLDSLNAGFGVDNISKKVQFNRVKSNIETLDSYNITASVIKIDVEGFELQVLIGMSNTLKICRPIVLVEFWNKGAASEIDGFMTQLGYAKW